MRCSFRITLLFLCTQHMFVCSLFSFGEYWVARLLGGFFWLSTLLLGSCRRRESCCARSNEALWNGVWNQVFFESHLRCRVGWCDRHHGSCFGLHCWKKTNNCKFSTGMFGPAPCWCWLLKMDSVSEKDTAFHSRVCWRPHPQVIPSCSPNRFWSVEVLSLSLWTTYKHTDPWCKFIMKRVINLPVLQVNEMVWDDGANQCIMPRNESFSLSISAAFLVLLMQVLLTAAGGCTCCNYRIDKLASPAKLAIKSLVVSWYVETDFFTSLLLIRHELFLCPIFVASSWVLDHI